VKNITKRDVKVFLLGMLALFLIEFALDPKQMIGDFVDGFKEGYSNYSAGKKNS
jgi:hypothetical protein